MGRPRLYFDEIKTCKKCGKKFVHSAIAQAKGRKGVYCGQQCALSEFKGVGHRLQEKHREITKMKEAGYI